MTSASNWASRPCWGHPTVTAHTSLTTLGKICQVSYRLPKQTADTDPTTQRAPALKTESQQSRGQCCVRSTREGKIVQVDIDYESRQPIHTPAYHTSEQSTLQTPHPTLSLSGPSHNISQYLRRFPSYDLQLTTYDFPALLYWDPLGPTTTNNHQQSFTQFNLSQQPANTYGDCFRVTTYNL